MFVSFASRFFGTACAHDMQRMASRRRSHRVGEDNQEATAAVRRVAKSFSAVSSWEPSSASSPTSPKRKSEARTAGARAAHAQRQPGRSIGKDCAYPGIRPGVGDGGHQADSQGVTEEGREHRADSSPTGPDQPCASASRERGRGWRVLTTRLRRPCEHCGRRR